MPPLESLERLGASYAALDAPVEKRRMLIIVNPYATTVSDRLKNLVVYALQGRFEVDAIDTEAKDHATAICAEAAAEGYDVVVSFGGDGTLNEVANGLAGSGTPLTALPGGATNVYCKMLGIPGDIVDATEHLLRVADDWRPREVALGKMNDRWFTFSAGVGLDASVVARVDAHPRLKTRLGAWYYTYAALMTHATQYMVRPPRLELVAGGGEPVQGVTAVIQNGDPYTYFNDLPLHVVEDIALDEPELGAIVLRTARATVMPGILWRIFSRRAQVTGHRAIRPAGPAGEIVVRTADDRPLPVQVDGDYIGVFDEARFSVVPGALTVVS